MSIFDDNFAYALVSSSDRTLQITGVNPAKYNAGNVNWGSIPAIPALYAGGTLAHNGYGAPENAFAVVEIANGAFNGRTEFAEGPLVLTNSLVRIGDNAFNGVKLSGRLTIPASVTYVGANAFANTLIDELLVENATMTDLLSGVVDATRVTSKEMEARAATDTTLTALKVTKANPGFTGTTTIATATISAMTVSGTATVQAANIAAATVNNTATVDYYENNVSEKNRNARVRVLSTAGNLLSVGAVNENAGAIEVVLSDGTYRTGAALVAALVTALNAKNIAWVGGQTISWNNTSFDANSNTVRLGYATNAPGSVMNPSIVIRTKFASNGLSYDSSSVLGAVGATVGATYEPGAFILAYGNRSGLNFPLAINLGTPTLTVNGNATLVGSGTVTGNWNFGGNKPKYDAQVLATESFTQSKIQLINGASLLSTVKTLADIASAIGADPQFAVHVQASQSTILQSVVSLASVRSTEVSALSSALTAQVSALQSADASLSSAISGAVPVRVSQVESVSAVLQTAVSQMQSADASISTALSAATFQQSSQTLSLNLAISTAASLLQNADTALSTSLSTATLTRSLNVSTNSSTWSAHVSALQTADALLSTAMVDATSARSSAITSLSSLVSTTVPVLASGNATVQTALSTATTDRVASVVSLSGAVSTQVETTQSLNAVLLPQITAAASVAPAATTNTVFNLVGIAVNDVLTFRMSGGSGGFATGNRITITYSPTDFLKGTVTAVSGSDITFQVNQKATSATETSIYSSSGYPVVYAYSGNSFVFQLPITWPVFTATSNFVITSVTASMFTDSGVGTYSVSLIDTNSTVIASSPSRQVNAIGSWSVMHTHTFTTAFVLNGATNLKIYAIGPWARMVINAYDSGAAYTAIRGYAVNYSSGSVFIESNGALQSRRISAVGALSTSALGQVGSLASVRLANQSGIALQTSERIASVSSILSATAQSVLSLQAATSTHGSAVSVAVSARNSGVSLLTSSINASVSSLSLSVASISGALSAQIVNRSSQVLAAVTSLVGAAPASLDTLFEIAATLDAGPTLYSTLDSTETLAASGTATALTVTAGANEYVINGVSKPVLTLIRGSRYTFTIGAGGHPFYFQTSGLSYSASLVYSPTGPNVVGIATQYVAVGTGVGITGNWFANYTWQVSGAAVQYADYRLRFSNGVISDLVVTPDRAYQGSLVNPDISFALTNIPAIGVTAILQGRNSDLPANGWFDVNVPTQAIMPGTTTIKFGGGSGTSFFAASPVMSTATFVFDVPNDAPNTLTYVSQDKPNMGNAVNISNNTRINEVAAVSASLSTAVSTLQLADASLSAGISTAVSDRISQAASLSSGASTFILSNQSTQSATSAGISDTASLRANGVASISTALAALSSAAQLTDLSASGSITAAISARQIGTTSTSAVLSTAVAGFQSVGAALSSAVSTATSVRQIVTASVSAALSGAVSGHHQTIAALSTAQSALSAGINVSALANLSDVNSAIGAVVGVGAVSALDTLNELATAISNNATIGTTLTGLINGKADQSVVAALSSAVLLKASQTDLTQLVSTVGTKAGDASVTQLQSAVSSMTVVTTSMSSQVQTLQTNMAASSQTIGLLSDTIRQVDTLYEYSGFVDANGAITYAVNNLSNMALQSSSLVFTIDAATYAVSKVAQLAVVRFDPTQTSVKYRSRGIEYPVDPVTLSGTYTYTFHVESSSATDYTNNATDLVITANPTALRTAPANSPFTVPKLALSGYTYAAPTVVTPYAAPTWSDATGKTSRVITVNFESGVQHLEVGGTVYAVVGTTQLMHTLEYLPGATGTLVIKALNSATKLESASLSLSDVYTDYPQHAAPTEVGGSKTVTTSGSTYTYTATYATTASMVEVYDYDAQTSAYAAVATSVPVVGGQVSVSRSYLVGQIGQPLFQLRAKTGDGKRSSTFIVATAEAITFSKPVQSNVSYTTLSAESYRVTATYTVHPLATAVRVMNPSTSGTYIASQAASGGSVTFSVDYTEGQSVTIAVITLANSGGLQSVASDAFVPLGQYDLPVQVASSKAITLSSGTYTQTAQYTSASPDGINVYAADGVTLVGSSTGASSPFTVTVTYAADKFGQTVALLSSKGTVNKRESARTTTITGEDIPTHVAPVISGAITYGTSGANYTAQMNYSVSSNVGAVRVLKADQTELPSGSTSVQQSVVSTTGSVRVISVTVTFSDAVAPVNIVVVAEANTYGKQSAASDAQMLLGLHAAPVKASDPVYTTVSAGSYTASMTYTVATGVAAVQVQKASDNTVVSGATSSINSLIATITVPFTDAVAPFNFVVVALDSSVGRKSVPSATQTLVSAFAAPTMSGKIATSSVTTYSISNPASRTHATTFPYLGNMSSWTMTVYFKCVNANTWRSLIGSDRFNISGNERNWGIWVPPTNVVQWCWKDFDLITPLAVTANVDYQLRITKTATTIRFDLMNVGTGATVSHTENHANLSMGANGPVTIGGWINTAEFSDTIIAGVHVGSYALAASYSTPSTTGIKTYSSRDAFIGTVSTPGSGTFNTTTPEYDGGQIGQAVMKVTAAADATKHESARLVVNGEDTPTYAIPVLSGAVSYTGTNAAAFANATYTVAPNATTVSVYSKPTGPNVTGIATQYATVGTGVSTSGNWYAYFVSQISEGIHFVHYRLRFSNGMVSDLSIYSNSPDGLTSPDLSFALSNIPASGVTAILQGRNNAYAGNVWYDINVASQAITPANTIIKFGGGTTHQFAASPAIIAGDTVVASATVTTPGTIALSIPYTEADVTGGKTFYVVADANTRGKQSAASVAQTLVGAFAAPTLNSVTYSGNTASMTYTVAAGVTEVQVRKASDNSVVSGVTSSINSLTATITVPFVDAVNVVVVALANSSGRESATSATQTLLGAFAAPVKASEPTYTTVSAGSYTANMTYTVAAGVTRVSALKASDTTYSVNPSSAMGQTLANFPTLGALKTWTVTMTQATGSMRVVKASEPTKYPLYIDFRSDKALLTQYSTAWGPDQVIMSGLHNLPRPTTFTVSFDANNFILRYGSGQVAVYPNHQSITSIDDIRNVPELINATYTGPVVNQFNRWEMSIAFRSTDKNNAWRALIGDMRNAVNARGWGVWISATNNIHFSWNGPTWEPTLTVAQNTDYVLVITKTSTSLTLELTNVAANTTQTATNTAMASYIMSANGPVTLGGWINETSENFVGTISYVNVVPALASSIASGTSATLTVPFTDLNAPNIVVVALASSVSRASAPSAQQSLLQQFTAPTLLNSVTYSGNTASMTYTVASGVTAVQVRKASDNSVVSGVTSSINSLTATITVPFTDAVNIVVVALANSSGRESAASAQQSLLQQFTAPVKASEPTYTTVSAGSYTASMTYTVATGVTAVQVRKASDNSVVSGVTSSINSLTATITVPFTDTVNIVVVALANSSGRESAASVAQSLLSLSAFTAPILSGSITYSGNTSSMTYTVATGVTAVQVRKASDNSVVSGVTSSINSLTATITVPFTDTVNIVVVALANSSGLESAPSAILIVGENRFPAPVQGTVTTEITNNFHITTVTYTVASGVIAMQTNNANATTSVSGTSATVVFPANRTISVSALGNGAYATSTPATYTNTTIPKIQISGYNGNVTSTLAFNSTFGSLGTGNFQFNTPRGIAHIYVNTGTATVPVIRKFLFVSNTGSNNVKVYSNASSNVASLNFHSDIGSFNNPSQIACFNKNDDGVGSTVSLRMAVADSGNHRIMIYHLAVDANGVLTITEMKILGVFGSGTPGTTSSTPLFNNPQGVAYSRPGLMYVADTNNHRIHVFNTNNLYISITSIGRWGSNGTGLGQLNFPSSIAVNAFNNVIVGCNNGVQIFASAGTFLTKISTIVSPSVAVDNTGVGKIIVTNPALNQIHIFSSGGALITTFGGSGQTNGLFNNPSGVTVDDFGNIYVCDRNNNRIQYIESIADTMPTLSSGITYSGTTASMMYTVGSSATAVEVRKASDNTVISGVTYSIIGTTATITVPFTNANATLSIVVVAVTNDVISAPSATLTLLNQFAAPTLNGSITYSGNTGNTATMTYNVADGVTEVQVRNATSQAVISSTTSVNTINRTASVSVNLTQNVSIVVVARANSYGRESPASFVQDLTYINFSALVSINGETIKYTGSSERVPMYTPLFISANLRGTTEWFAVVRQDMKNDIANYGYYNTSSVFTPPSSSVPVIFNNIITTFMTNMSNLFRFLTSFNQPIGSWDTSNVTNMTEMFREAKAFNQPIGSWNTSNVIHMIWLFRDAEAFNQPIGSWNTSAVTDMQNMFNGAAAFNQPIGSWNTSAVLNMSHMFSYAIVFNQPIGSWNTAAVDDMTGMFYYATAFVQNVSAWVINSNNQVNTQGFGRYSGIGWDYAPPVFRNSQSFG